ncbi:Crp/Fnr family transcriptional regulator [Shewanella sp. SR44-3]|uniref:Crp/Fnr family transcriptional regulator n=1 Tax=unclassified Shewanella TaxID=196818 RepID=UPI0015FB90F5|nr:Crp/Fnr family transcriptional regulator [Shewanella sp. SR44-3]MBB1270467.1 Crp/Fnr family transcriptional regulator [Shewanella sp. SR44-3]
MLANLEVRERVKKHQLFSSLSVAQLAQVFKTASVVHMKPEQVLFHQGDVANRFYFVLAGTLQLFRTNVQGQMKVIEVVRCGGTFAEALMFNKQASFPVSAQSVSGCELVSFDSDTYLQLLKQNPDACIAIMADLSVRIRKHINEVEMVSLQNAQHRLLLFLLRNMKILDNNQAEITLDIPKRLLASRLSIQPETFSRLMKKMTQEGLIHEAHGVIHIPNVSQLYASSDISLSLPEFKQQTAGIGIPVLSN